MSQQPSPDAEMGGLDDGRYSPSSPEWAHIVENPPVHGEGYVDPGTVNEDRPPPVGACTMEDSFYHSKMNPSVDGRTMHRFEGPFSTCIDGSQASSPARPLQPDHSILADLEDSSLDLYPQFSTQLSLHSPAALSEEGASGIPPINIMNRSSENAAAVSITFDKNLHSGFQYEQEISGQNPFHMPQGTMGTSMGNNLILTGLGAAGLSSSEHQQLTEAYALEPEVPMVNGLSSCRFPSVSNRWDDPWSHVAARTPALEPSSQTQYPEQSPPEPLSSHGQSSNCEWWSVDGTTSLSSIGNARNLEQSMVTVKADTQAASSFPINTEDRGHGTKHNEPAYGTVQDYSHNPPMLQQYLGMENALNPAALGSRPHSVATASSSSCINSQFQQDSQAQGLSTSTSTPLLGQTNEGGKGPCLDPILCDICGKPYSGEYRRGNLARHKRQKHGNNEQLFLCEDPACAKAYRRQDARLKHYRRRHSYLAPEPPVARPR